jgi:hypothetical protein
MAKADPKSTTNTPIFDATSRRNFLTSAAGIAAGATAMALTAVPALALALPADPVFAAIDAHLTAVAETDRQIVLRTSSMTLPVLPRGEWRMIDVRQRDVTVQVSARLLAVVTALPEGFAIFEVREVYEERRAVYARWPLKDHASRRRRVGAPIVQPI